MSHFACIVIGDDIDAQLQPYHEFECTGTDDEYVQDIDITERTRESYESATRTVYRFPDGSIGNPYDDRYYRDPTPEEAKTIGIGGTGCGGGISWTSQDWEDGRGYRSKVHFKPDNAEEVEIPVKSLISFREYAIDEHGFPTVHWIAEIDLTKTHKFGYILLDRTDNVVKIINRTNPNHHWDWWTIGGRWKDFFKIKLEVDPLLCDSRYVARALKKHIDFDGMRDEAETEAMQVRQMFYEILSGREYPRWPEFKERFPTIEAARTVYHAHPVIKDFRENDRRRDFMFADDDDIGRYLMSEADYRASARSRAICPFAIVKDSQWYARGEMGWWGTTSDEISREEWATKVAELFDSTPDDTMFTIVDCHT